MPRSRKPLPIAEPFVRWVGGKRQLATEILKRLPDPIEGTYFEPFVGGGAIFFALAVAKRIKAAYLGDMNPEIIAAYQVIRDIPNELIIELGRHKNEKPYYLAQRALDPLKLPRLERAVRFLFLNRTCFNGLYRVNSKGGFNVPFGDNPRATICDARNIHACSEALQIAKIDHVDVMKLTQLPSSGDVVYCDPPYWPVSKTSDFTAYTQDGFGASAQILLRNRAALLGRQGVKVLLSNADVPQVRDLYRNFTIEGVSARRSINNDATKRGPVGELLISNW